jgi:competence protein ComEA
MEQFIIKIMKYKKELIIGGIVLVLLIIGVGFYWFRRISKSSEKQALPIVEVKKEIVIEQEQPEESLIGVDIKGEINNPGVYLVNASLRVNDIIALAGGLTNQADPRVINLAKKVFDEMVIIIYSKTETNKMAEVLTEDETKLEECLDYQEIINNDACMESSKEEIKSNKININTATKEELMTLSGIGESKALGIINYREKEGLFKTIEDLMNVSGIGEAAFAKIKDFITI